VLISGDRRRSYAAKLSPYIKVRHLVNRDLILFGIAALVVGLGTGYLIYAHPEGLNPAWPIWMASLAPAVFALGGLHMVAGGLGYPRFSSAMLQAIAVC
jgi:hypothetical protein